MFAGYHESYITKDAAEMLRLRMRQNKANHRTDQSSDYDDLLQEITVQKPKQDIYDKRYYDYLPADKYSSTSLETNDENWNDEHEPSNVEQIEFQQLTDDDNNEEIETFKHETTSNSRRMKRSVTLLTDELPKSIRQKRQAASAGEILI